MAEDPQNATPETPAAPDTPAAETAAPPAPEPKPKPEEKYEHDEKLKPYVALGVDPVRAEKPVGDPVRYEDEFEQLQGQMDRLTALTGEQIQWPTVVSLGSDILKSKSKDLLVMTYLGVGLFEEHGYKGLAAALDCYTRFMETFWTDCFPKVKPPHGRLNAIGYLFDRVLPGVEIKGGQCKRQPKADEKEAVHACADLMEGFIKVIDEKFTGLPDSPNTGPLNRALRALKQKVGPIGAEAEAAAAAAAAPPTPGAPAAAATPGAAPAGPAGYATPAQAIDQVKRIARYLFQQDNKDARGYRLSRLALLGNLTEPKDRLIPGIAKPTRNALETLASSGDWQNLLNSAESQFLTTPLWLDLQRYVATALNGMGPMYEAAKKAVVFETIALEDRLPSVFKLSFKDGEPFADGATNGWLAEARKEFGVGGGGGGGGGDDRLATALSEARKESKPEKGVARLNQEVDGSAGRRDQFRARLELAKFCMGLKKIGVAQSILQGLDLESRKFDLDQWEPSLAAEALQCLYECTTSGKGKPTPADLAYRSGIFARFCCLNPSAALKLDGVAAPAAPPPAAPKTPTPAR